MFEYSIERNVEKIYISKTKEYFKEVLSSYSIGNYRSAIVMLHSVIVADLFYKLKELRDRDEDEKAIQILDYIQQEMSKEKKKYSEWETMVVEKVVSDTQLLEPGAKVYIDHIKQLRHLSAHPVIDSEDLLATPNKDTVRSAMRNALDYILTRPAMYNEKVALDFMEKIPTYSSLILKSNNYETYLKNKYFTYFTEKLVKKAFSYLWIATYRGQDTEATEYREEYFDTLKIVYKIYKGMLDNYFIEEKNFFNRIDLGKTEQLNFFIEFFYTAPHLYEYISQDNKVIIEHMLEKKITLFTRAWFITGNMKEHLNIVYAKFLNRSNAPLSHQIHEMSDMAKECESENEFHGFCIKILNKGNRYTDCLSKWKDFIRPHINNYSKENILELLSVINSNNSLYNANWLKEEYLIQIKQKLIKENITIKDWDTTYPNLIKYDQINLEQIE
ncbi:hypothetical protein LIT25_27330 (plasmid) [Bacillus sp. F19]|nr:hypothetical protein LIT25_27330 [Bacillus sp. F19]